MPFVLAAREQLRCGIGTQIAQDQVVQTGALRDLRGQAARQSSRRRRLT